MVDLCLLDNWWVLTTLIFILGSNLLKLHTIDPSFVYRFIAFNILYLLLLYDLGLEYEFLWAFFSLIGLLPFSLRLFRVWLSFKLSLNDLEHLLLVIALSQREVFLLDIFFRTLVDQELLILEPNLLRGLVGVLVLTVEVLLGLGVLSDVDFVPHFFLLTSLDIDEETNKVLWILLHLLSHEHTVVVECFVHEKSPDIVLVIVCQAELYLSFPVRFIHLHILLLLLWILDFYRLEISLFGLNHLFLYFFVCLALAKKFIFLL